MRLGHVSAPAFVIKPHELPALNLLGSDFPRPRGLEWIDRGKNAKLRPTSVEMLMRTLFQENCARSVQRLHNHAGLRVIFRSEADRETFAKMFRAAIMQFSTLPNDIE